MYNLGKTETKHGHNCDKTGPESDLDNSVQNTGEMNFFAILNS